ncbi:MAG TPA: NAD(P)H-dependent glycerol-3-phosphate dehydrogenase [Rhodobacteraceae bacterium]|nr:NAD(P)H-dependent glycerol-3-phosphate dehydrogenase [Paracoccaceae bacterium]
MKIGIIGAGAFGSALAVAYGQKGLEVALWARGNPHAREYPDTVFHTNNLADLEGAAAILLVVPAQKTAAFLKENKLPAAPLVLCAKGIDTTTGKLQSEIAAQYTNAPVSILTGPGFAGEIAAGLPTALTLAGGNAAQQALLSTPRLRLYRSNDLIGAQAGGALKNVIALACGMAIGAGLGESARAALLTRGFAEMQRLGVALGGKAETFQGLSGLGDLALTCASKQSRNFAQGLAFGQGNGQTGGTVEGLATAEAAAALATKLGVDAPITTAVAGVVSGRATVESAMQSLLARPLKEE